MSVASVAAFVRRLMAERAELRVEVLCLKRERDDARLDLDHARVERRRAGLLADEGDATAASLRGRVREVTSDLQAARETIAHLTSRLAERDRERNASEAQAIADRILPPRAGDAEQLRAWLRLISVRARGLGASLATQALHGGVLPTSPTQTEGD